MSIFKLIPLEERIVLDAAIAATVIYVDVNASGGNNGSSWHNAYSDLQSALTQAASTAGADQIWVADGTYKATSTNDRTISFNIPDNVSIYGGFKGNENSLSARNPSKNLTLISGDIGVLGVASDNTRTLLVANAATVTLDGLTVANAYNDLPGAVGVGLLINNASDVTVNQVVFRDNTNTGGGVGGAFTPGGAAIAELNGSMLHVSNSVFAYNASLNDGAVSIRSSIAYFNDSLFDHNNATGNGGAIRIALGEVHISGSDFTYNTAGNTGGAIGNGGGILTIHDSSFKNNSATRPFDGFGGAIFTLAVLGDIDTTITDSRFVNNVASGSAGGAIVVAAQGAALHNIIHIDDTLFKGNTAVHDANPDNTFLGTQGGAIATGSLGGAFVSMTINDSVFDGNQSSTGGGAISSLRSLPFMTAVHDITITDSVFKNNHTDGQGGAIFDNAALTLTIIDSKFEKNTAGVSGGAIGLNDLSTIVVAPYGVARTVNIIDSKFDKNSAPLGGAIALIDHATDPTKMITLNLEDSKFQKNSASNLGGAYYQSGGISWVLDNKFDKNYDPNNDEVVVDLPASVNGQSTAAAIIHSLVNNNSKLDCCEISVIP